MLKLLDLATFTNFHNYVDNKILANVNKFPKFQNQNIYENFKKLEN